MANQNTDVEVHGWELYNSKGNSQKYYCFLVIGGADPAFLGVHGRVNDSGNSTPKPDRSLQLAATAALRLSRTKEREGYEEQTREFTSFTVPAELVTTAALSGSARELLRRFRDAAGDSVAQPFRSPTTAAPAPHTDSVKPLLDGALATPPPAPPTPPSGSWPLPPAGPAPLGPQLRPNGQMYFPRRIGHLEDLAFLRDARDQNVATLLTGPPGTGKTAMIEAAFAMDATAGHSGLETLVGTGDTTEHDFLGTFVQNPLTTSFDWVPGPLLRSVQNDVPLFVDEIALIPPTALSLLYPLMDGRGELTVTVNPSLPPVKVGKNWCLVAACNPDVPGAHMSEALLSRFANHVQVTTDWDLAADLGVPTNLITFARNLETRKFPPPIVQPKRGGGTETIAQPSSYSGFIPQFREALAFAAQINRYGLEFALAGLLRRCPEADRAEFAEALAMKYPELPEPMQLGARLPQVSP
ncbi:AAA family ATPase [Streptacidiphilus sp. EB103A]|uniref:AAA family ATPase n=1 Tax=Streptacidiphilus sp. EB103A TaxID=3156275 RepID=UPI003515C784